MLLNLSIAVPTHLSSDSQIGLHACRLWRLQSLHLLPFLAFAIADHVYCVEWGESLFVIVDQWQRARFIVTELDPIIAGDLLRSVVFDQGCAGSHDADGIQI